jgi:hypothetical protein
VAHRFDTNKNGDITRDELMEHLEQSAQSESSTKPPPTRAPGRMSAIERKLSCMVSMGSFGGARPKPKTQLFDDGSASVAPADEQLEMHSVGSAQAASSPPPSPPSSPPSRAKTQMAKQMSKAGASVMHQFQAEAAADLDKGAWCHSRDHTASADPQCTVLSTASVHASH